MIAKACHQIGDRSDAGLGEIGAETATKYFKIGHERREGFAY